MELRCCSVLFAISLIYSYVSLIQKRKQKRSGPPLLPRELKIDEVNPFRGYAFILRVRTLKSACLILHLDFEFSRRSSLVV